MVRLKQTFPGTVQLLLTGPKSILPERQVGGCIESDVIDQDTGIFACTMRFCPSSPKDGEGWRAEIHEKISEFVGKFERKRKQYAVRFCHPSDISAYQYREVHTNGTTNGAPSAPKPQNDQQRRRTRAPPLGPAGHRFTETRTPRTTPTFTTRRPNIVIPTTQGAAPRNRTSTRIPAQIGNYQRPRYHNANGLTHTLTSGRNQQLHYGTRLKRRHEQTMAPTGTRRKGQRNGESSGAKQKRMENGHRSATQRPSVIQLHQLQQQQQQVLQQRQIITRGSATTSEAVVNTEPEASAVPRIDSVQSMPAVKVELLLDNTEKEEEVDEEEWSRHWDEFDEPQRQVNGNRDSRAAGSNDDDVVDLSRDSDDHMMDDASMCPAATQEENELITEGISVEDVKSLVEGRITRFSNAYMLRVKTEIRKLRQNNLWDRNVSRSPLSCYLLTELFKE